MVQQPERQSARGRWRAARPHAIAGLVFLLAAHAIYGDLWRRGPERTLAIRPLGNLQTASLADTVFEAWLVSRHARTLTTAPHRLFDTEHCAPAQKTLTLGIPMITMGVLAIPAWWLTGDPILTFNLTLVLMSLLGAAAMYALVVAWTGVPAAGIAAGLLFAFHPVLLLDITHPSVYDITWTVLALLFAERWFARGRWPDALLLLAATVLQIGASFYPLLAAVFLTLPFLAWLLSRDGFRHVRPAQVACVAGGVALGAALLLGPYLGAETASGGLHRSEFRYAHARLFTPSGWLFPGFATLALAAGALLVPRHLTTPRIGGDPRASLVAGALLALLIALGDNAGPLPNLHRALAWIPGLDAVRMVVRLYVGTHLALALLAGLGVAAAIRLGPRTLALPVLLVAVCAFDVLRAPDLGFPRRYAWWPAQYRPDPDTRAFFAKLAEIGNEGPILELPFDRPPEHTQMLASPRILQTLFHGRRTSACYGSYLPPERADLLRQARRLPAPDALAALHDQGFTTIVLHRARSGPALASLRQRLERAAAQGQGLELLHATASHVAFALRQAASAAGPPAIPGTY